MSAAGVWSHTRAVWAMVLAALTLKTSPGLGENLVLYPLALGGVSIIALTAEASSLKRSPTS